MTGVPPRQLACLLILGTAMVAAAQPVFTAGQFSPQPGQVFNFLSVGGPQTPLTGPDRTWYYAGLQGTASGSTNYVDPAGTSAAGSFPTATVADQPPGFDGAFYYASSATEEVWLGYFGPPANVQLCTDPRTLLAYPFTYGSTAVDDFYCIETGAVYDRNRSGTTTITAVGYGTLILPYGTFPDCLLLRVDQTYTDDYAQLPFGYVVAEAYQFIQPGLPVPLLSFSTSSYTQDGGTITSSGSTMLDPLSTGLPAALSANEAILVQPNPTSGPLTLQRGSTEPAVLEVIAADGRVWHHARTNAINEQISLAGLPDGLYLVRLTTATGTHVQRVMKEG